MNSNKIHEQQQHMVFKVSLLPARLPRRRRSPFRRWDRFRLPRVHCQPLARPGVGEPDLRRGWSGAANAGLNAGVRHPGESHRWTSFFSFHIVRSSTCYLTGRETSSRVASGFREKAAFGWGGVFIIFSGKKTEELKKMQTCLVFKEKPAECSTYSNPRTRKRRAPPHAPSQRPPAMACYKQ